MSLIENLTPEQEALIPVYREKWQKIALSTERIDREKATEVVKAAYTAINKQDPEIIFCESPYAGLKIIYQKLGFIFKPHTKHKTQNYLLRLILIFEN